MRGRARRARADGTSIEYGELGRARGIERLRLGARHRRPDSELSLMSEDSDSERSGYSSETSAYSLTDASDTDVASEAEEAELDTDDELEAASHIC